MKLLHDAHIAGCYIVATGESETLVPFENMACAHNSHVQIPTPKLYIYIPFDIMLRHIQYYQPGCPHGGVPSRGRARSCQIPSLHNFLLSRILFRSPPINHIHVYYGKTHSVTLITITGVGVVFSHLFCIRRIGPSIYYLPPPPKKKKKK